MLMQAATHCHSRLPKMSPEALREDVAPAFRNLPRSHPAVSTVSSRLESSSHKKSPKLDPRSKMYLMQI